MAVRAWLVDHARKRVVEALEGVRPRYRHAREVLDGPPSASLIQSHARTQTQHALVQLYTLHNHLETAGLFAGTSRETPCIVSLTTIPSRYGSVHLTIESVFQQTCRPDRVVLWLDDPAFQDRPLTPGLERLQARGLEVRRCSDIRSYKKLLPVLEENPDATIVTIDDDCFYPPRWLELLMESSRHHPDAVVYHRGRVIRRLGARELAPYGSWGFAAGDEQNVVPTGVGGVLYPPGCFGDSEVLDVAKARELCPTADDLWFRAMTLRAGTPLARVPDALAVDQGDLFSSIHSVPSSQQQSLFAVNLERNNRQFHAVLEAYDLWDVLSLVSPTEP